MKVEKSDGACLSDFCFDLLSMDGTNSLSVHILGSKFFPFNMHYSMGLYMYMFC